ncbi:ATP-dependent DNA ligase [Candidatus Woesearchaeota archaeon]|nr:ATP-dependent DNA ligase [Candidatus Woesearchaeota archaeon]
MKFSQVAKVYEQLESISSGNKMREVLASLLKKASKSEIKDIAYLTLGNIGSAYENIVIGMADKMVLKALGAPLSDFKKKGDIGLVAEEFVSQSRPTLKVKAVIETLRKIAKTSGAGSQESKIKLLASLFKKATKLEAKYIARIVSGQLRLGVGDKTVLDALSISKTGSKTARKALEHAYNVCPDVGLIAETFKKKGARGVENMEVQIGRPVQAMLCQRVKHFEDIGKRLGFPLTADQKYDGERMQIHKDGNKITLFSRRLDDITNQFPDVVKHAKKRLKAKRCIIDSECCPVDKKGNLLKFQTLMKRKRKHKVEEYTTTVPVTCFLFDVLYYNKSVIDLPYPKRNAILKKILTEGPHFKLTSRRVCKDLECAKAMFDKVIAAKGEGIVAKGMKKESKYTPGLRGYHWIKWKPEYTKGLRDTFDLAVVGAYRGRGKRAGAYGAILCAAYNKSKDRFETFCKVGSGFTDEMLAAMPKKFRPYVSKNKPARLDIVKTMHPDIWFEPGIVIEVTGGEITKSPYHTCGKEKGQGLALRFPRFLRYRDKKPEQATSVREIKKMV